MLLSRAIAAACTLSLGCAALADEEIDDPIESPEDALEPADDELALTRPPCNNLVASLPSPTGSMIDFCVLPEGGIAIGERAPLHLPPYADNPMRHWRCAADLYADLAPVGSAVPVELEEDCERRTAAGEVPLTVEPVPPVDLSQPGFRSHYCAASTGAVDFQQERCGPIADAASGYYDSLSWCRTAPTISTQRTATSQIGHKVNLIRAVVASCNGTSNLKLKSRTTGNWSTDVDQDVNSGYWASYYVSWTGSAVDRDFRFNGVAYGNAWYRNTGHFIDFQWP
ncbi:MAG TPA: hypothetical protein VKZ63_12870 [Kofleriaceae bacterium]|nr:hypothetical protein [Kofleriaceae bacterium]